MVKRLRDFGGVIGSGELIIFKNALFEETLTQRNISSSGRYYTTI